MNVLCGLAGSSLIPTPGQGPAPEAGAVKNSSWKAEGVLQKKSPPGRRLQWASFTEAVHFYITEDRMETVEKRIALLQAASSLLAGNKAVDKLDPTNPDNLGKFSHWTKTLAVYLDQRLGESWEKN